jgi:thioredoxin-like negative regulator of GroEL
VGDDFERRVFDSKKEALVLVYHPHSEKNRELKSKFESLAESMQDSNMTIARYNGVNQSPVYKNPSKLPALVLFKKNGDLPEIIEFD